MSIYSTFDQATLDREYSPSSCVDDITVYLNAYADQSRTVKDAALEQDSCISDLAYGPSGDEKLDLFMPRSAGHGAPLHIYIHGGYWQALNKSDSLFAAPMFQQHGSFFAAINYSLAPHASLTQIVEQNRQAISWLYKHSSTWGIDHGRIFLSGSSAGAHLVAMMLQTDWSHYDLPSDVIKGVCAVSGIYDLEPIRLSYVNEALGMDHLEAATNSPHSKPLRNHCPLILAYGDNETAEFKRQTDEYRHFLLAAGETVNFAEIEGRNHFDVIMDLANPASWLAQSVIRQMGLADITHNE
jgi:arylformamidase